MRIKAPKSVLLSVALILTVHAAALWPVIVWAQNNGVPASLIYTAIAVLYALLVIWLFFIVIGKSWARTAYTVFTALGFVAAVGRLEDFDVLTYILWAARIAAVILLYVAMSEPWFMRRSPGNPLNPNVQP